MWFTLIFSVVTVEEVAKDDRSLATAVGVLGQLLPHAVRPQLELLVGLQGDKATGLQAGVGGQQVHVSQGHRVTYGVAAGHLGQAGGEKY